MNKQTIAEKLQKKVVEGYSIESVARKHENMYRELVRGNF
jgi:hypothetical protein